MRSENMFEQYFFAKFLQNAQSGLKKKIKKDKKTLLKMPNNRKVSDYVNLFSMRNSAICTKSKP